MFGERLREQRKKHGMTMKELGKKFGLAESTISGYENGAREPDFETLVKFADFFDCSIDYLLGRTDVPRTHVPLSEKDKELLRELLGFLKKYIYD